MTRIGLLLLFWIGACSTTNVDRVYVITLRQGESLAELAARYDTTWKRILSDNELSSPEELRPGMKIRIVPGPGGYIVSPREEEAGESERKGFFFDDRKIQSLQWPVKHPDVSSHFGLRNGRPHEGVDFRARRGTPVMAAASGVVEFAARNRSYGRTVVLNHKNFRTLYAHLDRMDVKKGQHVSVGQVVGTVGSTGRSRGDHLHFEVRDAENKPQNPLDYLGQRDLLSLR